MPSLRMDASVVALPLVMSARLLTSFNRALQSVVGSVIIAIGATSPGDYVQFDSIIAHKRRSSREVASSTNGHISKES